LKAGVSRVVIVGGGHNGLVAACYLAEAGFAVTVLERRPVLGGLCVTEELIPGFRFSSVASWCGMLRPRIVNDLALARHGYQPYLPDPQEVILLPDGDYVTDARHAPDGGLGVRNASGADRDGWAALWGDIAAAARVVDESYLGVPAPSLAELEAALLDRVGRRFADGIGEIAFVDLARRYVTHQSLVVAACTTVFGLPTAPGNVLSCVHKGTAETEGRRGAWGFVRGGMGAITGALTRAARERGATLLTDRTVARINVHGGRAGGVTLADGAALDADLVVSNADPEATSTLVSDVRLSWLPPVRHPGDTSAAKVHLALSRLPSFPGLDRIGHPYVGTLVFTPGLEELEAAYVDHEAGRQPEHVILSTQIPSLIDASVAPPGRHVATIDLHYVRADDGGRPWTAAGAERLYRQTLQTLARHSPDLESAVIDHVVISPEDLRRTYGVTTHCCWQVPMRAPHLGRGRTFGGPTDHATAIRGLWMCGAGTHPGPNVTGAGGYNCAHEIIQRAAAA
jgi:phytoene dehydrogenase-like protein